MYNTITLEGGHQMLLHHDTGIRLPQFLPAAKRVADNLIRTESMARDYGYRFDEDGRANSHAWGIQHICAVHVRELLTRDEAVEALAGHLTTLRISLEVPADYNWRANSVTREMAISEAVSHTQANLPILLRRIKRRKDWIRRDVTLDGFRLRSQGVVHLEATRWMYEGPSVGGIEKFWGIPETMIKVVFN